MATAVPGSVALPALYGLQRDALLKPYDKQIYLRRAMKVFVMSYSMYDVFNTQMFRQKCQEFYRLMIDMYRTTPLCPVNHLPVLVRQIQSELAAEPLCLTMGAIKYRSVYKLRNPRIVIKSRTNTEAINLDARKERQSGAYRTFNMDFNSYLALRKDDRNVLRISVEADFWGEPKDQNEPVLSEKLIEFVITYLEISAEGFEDWFYFGRGLTLLIKMEFKVTTEPNITQEEVSDFHLITLVTMINSRLRAFDSSAYRAQIIDKHRPLAAKHRLSYIRPKVDPTTAKVYWTSPVTTLERAFESLTLRPIDEPIKRTVKYIDLQIGYQFPDEFEDKYCLCDEWCNWNAFFYHNPIYRFLIVCHHQLYMTHKLQIPDIYLFAPIVNAYLNGQFNPPPNSMPMCPVMKLIHSAADYRKKFFEKYFMKHQRYRNDYLSTRPAYQIFIGLSYGYIRDHTRITELCLQLNTDPFADLCVEHLMAYYSVLSDLHKFVGYIPEFVPITESKLWFKELDKMSRKQFSGYLKMGYYRIIGQQDFQYDNLFTEDYEYSSRISKCEEESEKRAMVLHRHNIQKSPLNIQVFANEFIYTLLSVYKFVKKVEPILPTAREGQATRDMLVMWETFDRDMARYGATNLLTYTISDEMLAQKGLLAFDKRRLNLFYSLKLYFIAYGIQSSSIEAMIQNNSRLQTRVQIFKQFRFIWNPIPFEQQFRTNFTENIFDIDLTLLEPIGAFYDVFWGKAQHEMNQMTQFRDVVQSVESQFFRLYHWWRNGGDNTRKFRRVFECFSANIENAITRSDDIYTTHIMEAINALSQKPSKYEYYLELWDLLVYYLVKSLCFVILSSIAEYLKQFDRITRFQNNLQNNIGFSLCKPGWVQMFATMRTAFLRIEDLKVKYIAFNDEFDRIDNTLSEMKHLIKNLYFEYYKTFINDWFVELDSLSSPAVGATLSPHFIPMHESVGLAFIAYFFNDFRFRASTQKNVLFRMIDTHTSTGQRPHHSLGRTKQTCIDYLSNPRDIQLAQPFLAQPWQTATGVFRRLDQMPANSWGFDLNLANI